MTGNIRLPASCDRPRASPGRRPKYWQHTLTCELRRFRGLLRRLIVVTGKHTLTCELRPSRLSKITTILGWQHTLTCELRRQLRLNQWVKQSWQHTLTCELRPGHVCLGLFHRRLATYAYVRVATTRREYNVKRIPLATYAYVRVATPKRSISLSSHTSFHMRMDFSTKRLLEFGFGFPKANPHWPLFPPSFSAPLLRFRSSGIRQIGTCPAPLKFPDRPYPVCNYQTPKLAGCRFPSLRMVSIARSCMYLKCSKVWLHCSRSTPFISALLFISKNAEYISL